jgi:lipid-A-disaccharide synthase
LLVDTDYAAEIKAEFIKIHHSLQQNTAEKAAVAILAHLS